MIMPITIAIRDGKEVEISSRELVPGDIILLRSGEKIPADCVIIEQSDLRVNEAVLTGESGDVTKTETKHPEPQPENLIFMGTHIVDGKCKAKILHTGMNTEFGKIANMISSVEKELPLQKKVNKIAKVMAAIAVVVSVIVGSIILLRADTITSETIIDVLIVIIALCVSAFPEAFPVVLISTLGSGAYRMAKQNAIVNRMSIIETLGEVTVVCTDKTGTITKGEMTAQKIYADSKIFEISGVGFKAEGEFLLNKKKYSIKDNSTLGKLIECASVCNDALVAKVNSEKEYSINGTPTEAALLVLGAKAGIFKDDLNWARDEEIPFNSERKMMTILCSKPGKKYIFSKGAPEVLLENCSHQLKAGKEIRLTKESRKLILETQKKFARKGLRVLALAGKSSDLTGENCNREGSGLFRLSSLC
jgi:P-type Ca2+ transporter type 2C